MRSQLVTVGNEDDDVKSIGDGPSNQIVLAQYQSGVIVEIADVQAGWHRYQIVMTAEN